MPKWIGSLLKSQQSGLVVIILVLGAVLAHFSGHHVDPLTGRDINNFLNLSTLVQLTTDTSFYAIMAVGMTAVIVSGGIDLSVGSIYAVSSVLMALALQHSPNAPALLALAICCGIGLLCGLFNGIMVAKLGVHPFIITLGTMWIYRGISFVTTGAESINVPQPLTDFAKATLGMRRDQHPVPFILTILVTILGGIFLVRTTWGRRIFAVGGNIEASRYSGLKIGPILAGVYTIAGLTAGLAGFLGCSFYGSASSADAEGYELYVIAAAVVGGASLVGGKGSASGAFLGALLIALIRQAIRTLNLNTNYEWIIIGVAIIVAVVLDRANAQLTAKRQLAARG
ncbi:MAG TPA: ABC transporter permease [Fimbriimonas sp.]|nr:ABC transporter permease [Fimbriimonas sp.]